ncbi:MAG: hypothetical protein HUU34_05100 [Saprospiraceae bacterium]|nr:hypothetical protein [Saprospiraceae bacterium]
MKAVKLYSLIFFALFAMLNTSSAQTVLFAEDFNGCALPAGWNANLTGNPNAFWTIGFPVNNDSDGSTIDGTCMFIVDDDQTGDQTPPWTLELTTPSFDATGYTTVTLSIDVNYRNYDGKDSLQLLVFDGQEYVLLAEYQGAASQTGTQLSQYATFTADLTFYANANMHLMIRYADGGTFAWWAGVDNIVVKGEGAASNLVLATFNDCVLPEGWQIQTLTGDFDWQMGYLINDSAPAATSMNGTCFAYFDDDGIGQAAAASAVRLYGPEIDGTVASDMKLYFDAIFRRYSDNEYFSVGVLDVETGESRTAVEYFTDLGGPQLSNYVHEVVDLSAFRARRMRFFFQYEDGGAWNWWVGIDNVKLTGEGELNEICEKALPIAVGDPCLPGNNRLALFDGPQPACSNENGGSLWYRFTPEESGLLQIETSSDFNEVITLFSGECPSLVPVSCGNRDEHGFTGEIHYVNVTAGQEYLLRVSGQKIGFGRPRGNFCLYLEPAAGLPPAPANDNCQQAANLVVDGDCVPGNNYNGLAGLPLPSRNTLSRADIWYRFTPADDDPLIIRTQADFADVITLYSGGCDNLTEAAVNEYGGKLLIEAPVAGQPYWLKVSGAFATVEGNLCAQVERTTIASPANDLCVQALPVTINGACAYAENYGADFDGPLVSCEPLLSGSIWFSFVAPASGTVRLWPDANFMYALSVYQGTCNDLEEIFCARNPLACDGYLTLGSLSPGQTYYVRISSSANTAGYAERGGVCFSVKDAATTPEFTPLTLDVNVHCFGNGVASLDIEAEGGMGNYVFQGHTENDVLAPGSSYLVVVTDANGCERSVGGEISCEVDTTCTLSAVLALNNPVCPGDTGGSAGIQSIEGGNGSYGIGWSTGATGGSIEQLGAGQYAVTISEEDGCDIALSFTLADPEGLAITGIDISPSVGGEANGSIQLALSGGVAPFVYEWYVGQDLVASTDEPVLPGALAGDYSLQVTDGNGCTYIFGPFTIDNITSTNNKGINCLLDIMPNPTSGPITLAWELPTDKRVDLYLVSVDGRSWRLARNLPAKAEAYHVSLQAWPAGVYTLRWSDGMQQWKKKAVIAR